MTGYLQSNYGGLMTSSILSLHFELLTHLIYFRLISHRLACGFATHPPHAVIWPCTHADLYTAIASVFWINRYSTLKMGGRKKGKYDKG